MDSASSQVPGVVLEILRRRVAQGFPAHQDGLGTRREARMTSRASFMARPSCTLAVALAQSAWMSAGTLPSQARYWDLSCAKVSPPMPRPVPPEAEPSREPAG